MRRYVPKKLIHNSFLVNYNLDDRRFFLPGQPEAGGGAIGDRAFGDRATVGRLSGQAEPRSRFATIIVPRFAAPPGPGIAVTASATMG
jgi:hypothetical protein